MTISLPPPSLPTDSGLTSLLEGRHSIREFRPEPVSLAEVSALLWAGYGFRPDGGRTLPSAGGVYPMALHVVAGDVTALDDGVYSYNPEAHQLIRRLAGDLRADLMSAALGQASVGAAPASIVVAGAPGRLRARYGKRSERYALVEAGHIGQNVALAAESLGLGTVPVGAFGDDDVAKVLSLPEAEHAYYIFPIGRPR
ncbi:MAG TPA: SagB/ThcOx family dehydrogenase [Actinomycetaceae bacterium]|nr:SagB/ThcOx family dehydrogenase [Actinomycetaceae bacterium]